MSFKNYRCRYIILNILILFQNLVKRSIRLEWSVCRHGSLFTNDVLDVCLLWDGPTSDQFIWQDWKYVDPNGLAFIPNRNTTYDADAFDGCSTAVGVHGIWQFFGHSRHYEKSSSNLESSNVNFIFQSESFPFQILNAGFSYFLIFREFLWDYYAALQRSILSWNVSKVFRLLVCLIYLFVSLIKVFFRLKLNKMISTK